MITKSIFRNGLSDITVRLVTLLFAIWLTPFLIGTLGKGVYGLWILASSFIVYFSMSDVGLRSAVGRYIAVHRAKNDTNEINKVVVTSLVMLTVTGLFITVAVVGCSFLFPKLFNIDPTYWEISKQVVLIVGITCAIGMPFDVFDGILVGFNRYDLVNGIEIISLIIRVLLTVILLTHGYGLIALAFLQLSITLVAGTLKVISSYRLFPGLRLTPEGWSTSKVKELYGFSLGAFSIFLYGNLSFLSDNLVIGWAKTTHDVAVYAIAGRLISYAIQASTAFNTVLMPLSSEYFARGQKEEQIKLMYGAIRASLLYAFFMFFIFILFGRNLIEAWVGPDFRESYPILIILAIPMLAFIAHVNIRVVLFAMGKLKTLAVIYLLDAAANITLSLILVKIHGNIGVALGTLITMTVTMFFIVPFYICKVLGISLREFISQTYGSVLIPVILLFAVLFSVSKLFSLTSLFSLGIMVMTTGTVYFVGAYYYYFRKGKSPFTEEKPLIAKSESILLADDEENGPSHGFSESALAGLTCGQCKGVLGFNSKYLVCSNCNAKYPVRHGVPMLGDRRDYEFQEIRIDMKRFLADVRVNGWDAAYSRLLAELPDKKRDYLDQYVNDDRRSAWKFLLQLTNRGVAVDFGCGWGALSVGLSHNFDKVYAVDLSATRLEATLHRSQAHGHKAIIPLQGGDTQYLPFAAGSVDAFALNGVLEYAGLHKKGEPRECQIAFLKEVNRVLASNGQVYIGIENRIGWRFFLGEQDHPGTAYTSLMPRWLANLYCRLRLKEPYRIYTHTKSGYEKMLREAGFNHIRFYSPIPHYSEYRVLVDLSNPLSAEHAFHARSRRGKLLMKLLRRWNFLRRFSHCYTIIASRNNSAATFPEEITRKHIGHLADHPESIRMTHMEVTRSNKTITFLTDGQYPKWVLLLGLNPSENIRIQSHIMATKSFLTFDRIPKHIRELCPPLLASGEESGLAFSIQSVARGNPALEYLSDVEWRETFISEACQILLELHVASRRPGVFSEHDYNRLCSSVVDESSKLCDLNKVRSQFLERIVGSSIPLVYSHFDYGPQHIFVDPSTKKITGIIDWEMGGPDELPIVDWFGFLVLTIHESEGKTLPSSYATVLKEVQPGGKRHQMLMIYIDGLGISIPQASVLLKFSMILSIYHKKLDCDSIFVKQLPALFALVDEWEVKCQR